MTDDKEQLVIVEDYGSVGDTLTFPPGTKAYRISMVPAGDSSTFRVIALAPEESVEASEVAAPAVGVA